MAAPRTIIAKGSGGGSSQYITDGIHKRLIAGNAERDILAVAQFAVVQGDGTAFILDQTVLNNIRTV
jgi:hypothetical protein